jgi:hypothetical protein
MSLPAKSHRYPTRFKEHVREKQKEEALRSFQKNHDSIVMRMGYPPDLIPYEAFHRFRGLSPTSASPTADSYYTSQLITWIHNYCRPTKEFEEGCARHHQRFALFRRVCLEKTGKDVSGIRFGLYYPVYCQWVANGECPEGLDRYQRMCRFIEEKRHMF